MNNKHAKFSHSLVVKAGVAYVMVTADEDNTVSLTNDAEYVIERLAPEYGERFRTLRVLYKDSSGVWDQMLHRRGVFKRFHLCDALSLSEAMLHSVFN